MLNYVHRFAPLLLKYPNFRWLWLARLVSQAGDIAGYVTLMLFVREMGGSSGLALAGLAVAQGIPAFLVGPFAGLAADRFRRTHVMIASDLTSAVLFALLPFASSVPVVYTVALLARLALAFFNPARQALMPDLVERDDLVPANAFMQGTWSVMLIVSPAIGAGLVGAVGYAPAFWFNTASFLLSAFFASRIHVAPRPARPSHAAAEALDHVRRDLLEGWAALRSNSALVALFAVDLFMATGMASFDVLEVLYIKDILGATDQQYGAVVMAAGLGGVLMAAILPRLQRRWAMPTLWAAGALLFGLTFFPYAATRRYTVLLGIVLVQMAMYMLWSILHSALLQRLIPDEVRGRVFGLFDTAGALHRMVTVVLFGLLVDELGIIAVFNLVGVVVLLGGAFAVGRAARLKRTAPQASGVEARAAELSA